MISGISIHMSDHSKKKGTPDKASTHTMPALAGNLDSGIDHLLSASSVPEALPNVGATPTIPFSIPSLTGTWHESLHLLHHSLDVQDLVLKYHEFNSELTATRKRAEEQARALRVEKASGEAKQQQIQVLQATLHELQSKEQIGFLLSRVSQEAQSMLLSENQLRKQFLETKECKAFVISVDIRRSTELMLKARSPEAFAEFITTLCSDLMHIITRRYGVFDKFTGDGVLAFYPDFYSGQDAAYHAVAAADQCHASFKSHYQRFRSSFTSVLAGTGLGIGIDFGSVHLLQMAGGLTVVGAPVVYACRLSGAPVGTTLVNQPAYEIISDTIGAGCFIDETSIDIKHEGEMLAYAVRLNTREYQPTVPDWLGCGNRDEGQT